MVGAAQPPVLWVGDGRDGGPAVYFRAGKALWRYDWTSGARPQRVEGELSRALDVGGDVWALRGPHDRGITFTTSDGNELGGQSFVRGMTWARDETAVMPAPDVSGDGQAGSVIACDASSLQCQSSKPVDNVALITLPTF